MMNFADLRRTNPELWPAPAKAGFKFTCGTAAGGKECLWRTSPPKHMLNEAPFCCIEAGCMACAEDVGYHPDTEPGITFNPHSGDTNPDDINPFGIPSELSHVPQEAYVATDAVCFVYTCRRLIDLALIAGTTSRLYRAASTQPAAGLPAGCQS